jgi:ActR/RegA family two-component response regulator
MVTYLRVLLVEPDPTFRVQVYSAIFGRARVDSHGEFAAARGALLAMPYDWVITNIRLEAFNGLHLVHTARAAGLPTRFLVYGERADLPLALEAQQAGAFYAPRASVHRVAAWYVRSSSLPPHDRRDALRPDRRGTFRRGRRAWERDPYHLLVAAP